MNKLVQKAAHEERDREGEGKPFYYYVIKWKPAK